MAWREGQEVVGEGRHAGWRLGRVHRVAIVNLGHNMGRGIQFQGINAVVDNLVDLVHLLGNGGYL